MLNAISHQTQSSFWRNSSHVQQLARQLVNHQFPVVSTQTVAATLKQLKLFYGIQAIATPIGENLSQLSLKH